MNLTQAEIFDDLFQSYKLGNIDEVLSVIDEEIMGKSEDFENLVKNNIVFFDYKKYTIITNLLNKILEINPNDSDILARNGLLLQIQNQRTESLSCLDSALKIDPKNIIALQTKGILFYNYDDYENAISIFDDVLKINPNDLPSLLGKGLSLESIGKNSDAVSYFVKALGITSNDDKLISDLSLHLVNWCGPLYASLYSDSTLIKNSDDKLALQISNDLVYDDELDFKISQFYVNYLHREPSLNDLKYWKQLIRQEKKLSFIEKEIKDSDEAKNYFN